MRSFASGVGLIPEQDWESGPIPASPYGTDPDDRLDRLRERPCRRVGVAAHLVGRVVRAADGRPRREAQRRAAGSDAGALRGPQPGQRRSLTVTSPLDHASVDRLAGHRQRHDRAGNTVYVAATNTDANSATTVVSAPAASDGSFSIDVPVTGGTSVLNIVAVSPTGGTAHVQRTILFDFVPGTLLLDVPDPDHDDNGPGNYAYPTSGNFHAGAFDIQAFQVYDAGTEIIFRRQDARPVARRSAARWGRSSSTSTCTIPGGVDDQHVGGQCVSRNFQIAPAFAWSRLIQARASASATRTRPGTTLGTDPDQRQPDLAVHHVPGAEGVARDARPGLGLRGRADRAGRVQPTTTRRAVSIRRRHDFHVRGLRDSHARRPLHGRPGHRSRSSWTSSPRTASASPTRSTTRSTRRSCYPG